MGFYYLFYGEGIYVFSVSVFEYYFVSAVRQPYAVVSVGHVFKKVIKIQSFIGIGTGFVLVRTSYYAAFEVFHLSDGKWSGCDDSRAFDRESGSRYGVHVIRKSVVIVYAAVVYVFIYAG